MKILAVDDKAMPRKVLVRAIEEASPASEVCACANSDEVLSREDLGQVDVAFIDIDMPGKNGVDLALEIKKVNPKINIVFATGYDEYMYNALAMHASGYLLKPITAESVSRELDNLRFPPENVMQENKLVLRCFGNFEVFYEGHALNFERSKTKEMLAYLVDRKGAVVSLHEIESVLWEDSVGSTGKSGSYLRTLVADLKHTLDACGQGDVLVKHYGAVGIDATQVSCDYYEFLDRDPLAINAWRGEYMEQYSWAESTKANLSR